VEGYITNNGGTSGMRGSYSISDSQTPSGIPADAWQQYLKIDTGGPLADYPGDAGFQQVVTGPGAFTFGCPAGTCPSPSPTYYVNGTQDLIMFRGFLYGTDSNFSGIGTNYNVHGLVYSPFPESIGSTIYYDQDVANQVAITRPQPTRIWWSDMVYSSWPCTGAGC
jgi:hypothetical protein